MLIKIKTEGKFCGTNFNGKAEKIEGKDDGYTYSTLTSKLKDRKLRRRLRLIDANKLAKSMDSGLRRKDERERSMTSSLIIWLAVTYRERGERPYSLLFLLTESAANVLIAQRLAGRSPSLPCAASNKKGALRRLFSSNNNLIWQSSS